MKIRVFIFIIFFFFCDLHSKEIYLDLEVDLPNKSSVSIVYHDKVNNFSQVDLERGVERKDVFDIVFFSNIKEAVEIILSSKNAEKEMFSFVEEDTEKCLSFSLFCMDNKKVIESGKAVYTQEAIKEPISKTISVGMRVPRVKGKNIISGQLSTHFTVILQHTG